MIIVYYNKIFTNYVLKIFIKLVNNLKNIYDDRLILIDGIDNVDINLLDNGNHIAICFEKPIREDFFNKSNITTIVYYDDCNVLINKDKNICEGYINYINKHDIFISTYAYLFYNDNRITSKIFTLYHCYLDDFLPINKNNIQKIEKVNILGTINQSYDLRNYINNNFKDNNDINIFKSLYYIDNGEYYTPHILENDEWYSYINKFKANFTDTGICEDFPNRKYLLSKFFEIGASNTLLLCDDRVKDELSFIGLEENIHYISCNQNNFLEKVNYILYEMDNINYRNIIKNCNYIIHKHHSISNRMDMFKTIINDDFYEINVNNEILFKMEILDETDFTSNYILKNKIFERNSTNLIINISRQLKNDNINNIFIDTSFNLGYYSLLLNKYFNNIYLFEPNIKNIQKIRNSILYNKIKNINLNRLYLSPNDNNSYFLYKNEFTKCITIDLFLKKNNINNVSLIKFDIINYNYDILNGSIESIKNKIFKNIIIKFNIKSNINYFELNNIINIFIDNNYNIYFIDILNIENINKSIILNIIDLEKIFKNNNLKTDFILIIY